MYLAFVSWPTLENQDIKSFKSITRAISVVFSCVMINNEVGERSQKRIFMKFFTTIACIANVYSACVMNKTGRLGKNSPL